MVATNPIFCAIDTSDPARARALAAAVAPYVGGIKLGLEFFTANGPAETGGGAAMLRAAAGAAAEAGGKTTIIGVTVLTSLDAADLEAVGQRGPVADQA